MKMKNIIFYSPDFSLCYSLLMYLQDRYLVTTTTDIEVLKSIVKGSNFDLVILDTEPTKEILALCREIKCSKNISVILTYVYKKQIAELDDQVRKIAASVFYKPVDLYEISSVLATL